MTTFTRMCQYSENEGWMEKRPNVSHTILPEYSQDKETCTYSSGLRGHSKL